MSTDSLYEVSFPSKEDRVERLSIIFKLFLFLFLIIGFICFLYYETSNSKPKNMITQKLSKDYTEIVALKFGFKIPEENLYLNVSSNDVLSIKYDNYGYTLTETKEKYQTEFIKNNNCTFSYFNDKWYISNESKSNCNKEESLVFIKNFILFYNNLKDIKTENLKSWS